MKKTISRQLIESGSVYIPAKKDGRDVIRVSGHLPTAANLLNGDFTRGCKNIYLIFVRDQISVQTRKDGAILYELVRLMDSNDPVKKRRGETDLNNVLVLIGEDACKGVNYRIINKINEVDATVKEVRRTLNTSVFMPLKYID